MEIAAHSAFDMFSKYSYLIVNLAFSHLGIWSLNFFLIAPFPDHCLFVPFNHRTVFSLHMLYVGTYVPMFYIS